jgi:hypothetical protein
MTDPLDKENQIEPEDRFGTVERVTTNYTFSTPDEQASARKDGASLLQTITSDRFSAKVHLAESLTLLIGFGIFAFGALCLGLFGVYIVVKTIFS